MNWENMLQKEEKYQFALRALYAEAGFLPYRMSKFEEYDLYARNKDFLLSDRVLTFTDTTGKLMALKPDVTLSIIKNSQDKPQETQRLYYNENVYRVSKSTETFSEIMQSGVECFGLVGDKEIVQVTELAAKSLLLFSKDAVLVLSDLTLLLDAYREAGLPEGELPRFLKLVSEKNRHELRALCGNAAPLLALTALNGTPEEVLPQLDAMPGEAARQFAKLIRMLREKDAALPLRVDLSLVDDINYYNGVVFKGFLNGLPQAVLSGGQYDRLMQKMQRASRAVGFAVYMDALSMLDEKPKAEKEDEWLNVALPKGRLGEKVYALFAEAGFECPAVLENSRRLIFENPEKHVRYFWVKPSDVAIYVARGAADIGVAGKDILLEYEPEVYELLDLNAGKCRMAVAAKKGFTDPAERPLRVATKFAGIARQHYLSRGRDIDIIHLNGSIELAPILGLSDVIVDIVETGTTLRENDLEVVETIVPISARLISNKASYTFKSALIEDLRNAMAKAVAEQQ